MLGKSGGNGAFQNLQGSDAGRLVSPEPNRKSIPPSQSAGNIALLITSVEGWRRKPWYPCHADSLGPPMLAL